MIGDLLGVGGDVEQLGGADAGMMAGGDISNRVAARLPRGEPRLSEPEHHRGDLLQLHKMELHILPGGDVPFSPRISLGDIGQTTKLFAVQEAGRNLDPDHLKTFLPLAVNTVLKPKTLK